jgi:hypothetical protein
MKKVYFDAASNIRVMPRIQQIQEHIGTLTQYLMDNIPAKVYKDIY